MNIPKLRFPEFKDEWSKEKLNNIVNFNKGNLLSKSDLDDNGKNKCILYGQLYTTYHEVINDVYSSTNKCDNNIPRSRIGDVLIPSSGETPIDISTASCIMLDNILLGGDINILRPINSDGRFLSYLISNNKRTEIAKVAQGHSIVHLYNDNLKQINLNVPSKQEQNKIANMLELLDKKMELQSKKIEDLKLFKKGLLTKLIIHINSNKLYTLNELEFNNKIKLYRGKIIPKVNNGKYPVYSSSTKNNGLLCFSDNFMFDEELITWSIDGGGNFFYRPKHKFSVTNVCGYIRIFDKNINAKYLYCYLDFLHSHIKFDYQSKAHPSVIKNLYKIKIPDYRMQKNIADIYTYFNCKEISENNKLIKLQELKKGLMQQMFV